MSARTSASRLIRLLILLSVIEFSSKGGALSRFRVRRVRSPDSNTDRADLTYHQFRYARYARTYRSIGPPPDARLVVSAHADNDSYTGEANRVTALIAHRHLRTDSWAYRIITVLHEHIAPPSIRRRSAVRRTRCAVSRTVNNP